MKKMFASRGSDHGKERRSKERRPLKTVALTPPDYIIDQEVLLKEYIEKEVKYLGSVPHIEKHLDPTNRTDILRIIDHGKLEGHLPWTTSAEHDAIFCINAFDVKISRRDGHEELLQRVPIHEIAAICYVTDGPDHMLSLKIGSAASRDCYLIVLHVDDEGGAEELCRLIGQCFQLVYTEATIQFFEKQLEEGGFDVPSAPMSQGSSLSTPKAASVPNGFMTGSSMDVYPGGRAPSTTVRSTGRSEAASSDFSMSSRELVHDYVERLQKRLSPAQLRIFATLMREREDMPVAEFCQRMLALYGDHKDLLGGLGQLLPRMYREEFSAFLEEQGIADFYGYSRRTVSETGSLDSTQTCTENDEMRRLAADLEKTMIKDSAKT